MTESELVEVVEVRNAKVQGRQEDELLSRVCEWREEMHWENDTSKEEFFGKWASNVISIAD